MPEEQKKPVLRDAMLRMDQDLPAGQLAAMPTAKAQIREMATVLRKGADSLDKLCDMLPEKPTEEQEKYLQDFVGFSIKTGLIQKFI